MKNPTSSAAFGLPSSPSVRPLSVAVSGLLHNDHSGTGDRTGRVDSLVTDTHHLTISAGVDDLAAIRSFVTESALSCGASDDAAFNAALIAHEMCSNLLRHAGGARPVEITLTIGPSSHGVRLVIVDRQEPFDPNSLQHDGDTPLDERDPGGLGLEIVGGLAASLDYESTGHGNVVTIIVDDA